MGVKYRVGIVDGVARWKESLEHIPFYQPVEGEVYSLADIPVPCLPIFNELGDVISFNPVDRNISYTISKNTITTAETATITTTPGIQFEVDGQEYTDPDGIIEYSNENPGTHQVILKGYEYFLDTVVEIEVVQA